MARLEATPRRHTHSDYVIERIFDICRGNPQKNVCERAGKSGVGDWVSGRAKAVCFRIDGKVSSKTQFNVVAFWRSNHLPVF